MWHRVVLVFVGLLGFALAFSGSEKQEIEKVIHHYLLNNPEVLIEAGEVLRVKQMQTGIQKNQAAIFGSTQNPVLGDKNGKVVVVEFFDYQCGYCKKVTPLIDEAIKKNSHVRFVFKEFPIFGEQSEFAAAIAIAAHRQNKFSAVHSALMQVPQKLTHDITMDIAKKAGLNLEQLDKDLKDPAIADELKSNVHTADAMNLSFTPVFIVGPYPFNSTADYTIIPGATSLDDLQKAIDKASGK